MEVFNNPGLFTSPLQFQITFDCLAETGLNEEGLNKYKQSNPDIRIINSD